MSISLHGIGAFQFVNQKETHLTFAFLFFASGLVFLLFSFLFFSLIFSYRLLLLLITFLLVLSLP